VDAAVLQGFNRPGVEASETINADLLVFLEA
jgi:hypothetical protein